MLHLYTNTQGCIEDQSATHKKGKEAPMRVTESIKAPEKTGVDTSLNIKLFQFKRQYGFLIKKS